MSTNEYITFQQFQDKELASELGSVLKSNNIPFIIEVDSTNFDPSFANNEAIKRYLVKLMKPDFEPARKVLQELSEKQLETVDPHYYLFEFTDVELIEIINKEDEWSTYDFLLAQKIMKERGKEIDRETIERSRKQRLQELSQPEETHTGWIIIGYISVLLGGLLGIFIGWSLRYQKKTIPDGTRFYAYNAADRKHGIIIFATGNISFIYWVLLKLTSSSQ